MTNRPVKTVLLIEDNPGDARLLREMLNEEGSHQIELAFVESMSAAETHLAEHAVDMVLLDLGLPDARGLEAVRRVHAVAPRAPLVVLTVLDDQSLASQALQEGAQDYLIKGQIETHALLRALRYASERNRLEQLKDDAEKDLVQTEGKYRGLLEAAPDAMVVVNQAGEIIILNLQTEKQFGYRRDALLGQKVTKIIPDGFAERLIEDGLRSAKDALAQQIGTGRELIGRRKGKRISRRDHVEPVAKR